MMQRTTLACLAGTALWACGGDVTVTSPEATLQAAEPAGAAPTFWGDVAPILGEKCTACHRAGGIAPFALDNYTDAAQRANLVAAMTESRVMPPYLMQTGGECGSFDEGEALSEEQIATIGAWARGERREGTPAPLPQRQVQHLSAGKDLYTPRFTPQIEGGPLAQFDEYRCFSIDLGLDGEAFITGFEFEPGNPDLVHHMIALLVDPASPSAIDGRTNEQVLAELDQLDPEREGWHCYSEAGDGVRVESSPGGWAPGAGAYSFPDGIGVRVQPGRRLVLQMHYNMTNPAVRGQSDQTRVRLALAPRVERQATLLLGDAFLGTLAGEAPAALEPGNPAARFSWTAAAADLGVPLGVPVEVLAVTPHMHERGRKYTFEVDRGDGFECQGHIGRWDFNWQRVYRYAPALQIDSATRLRVSCEYDTRADSEPVLPGWGTHNEMCTLSLLAAFPPGVQF